MSNRPFFTILAAASLSAIAGLASIPSAQAMPLAPMTAPSVSDTTSGAAVPGAGLIEQVRWHGGRGGGRWHHGGGRWHGGWRWHHRGGPGWGWHHRHGFCWWHPHRCGR